jgi:hypothetical protein
MDLDSLIYIIIAIALAIINAVAQKKKKADKEKAAALAPQLAKETPLEDLTITDSIEKDPLEILLEKEFFREGTSAFNEADFITEKPLDKIEEVALVEPDNEYQKYLAKAQELLSQGPQIVEEFDFEENSIASTSIGDVLTKEEQDEADNLSLSEIQREFDIKKAIIYTEILKPKYFSPHIIY